MRMVVAFVATGMMVVIACAGTARGADAKADALAAAHAADARNVKLLRSSAARGESWGQGNLGLMYYFGRGVPKDYAEAARLFRKAAEKGVAWAQSQLGGMYLEGQGVPKDDAEGVRWFRKAAEQGYTTAQASLGLLYESGLGVSRDYVQAYMWLNIAAAGGGKLAAQTGADKLAAQNRDRLEHSMTVQ